MPASKLTVPVTLVLVVTRRERKNSKRADVPLRDSGRTSWRETARSASRCVDVSVTGLSRAFRC